jgi:hypothetical protein
LIQPQKHKVFLKSWHHILKHGRDNASIPQLKELEHEEATISAEKGEKES